MQSPNRLDEKVCQAEYNPALLACWLVPYATHQPWYRVAAQLGCSLSTARQLALARKPRRRCYDYDIAALARRHSIERRRLAAVLNAARRVAESPFEAVR
jgi:hypothetical protein